MCKGKAVYPMTAWRHLQRTRSAGGETLDDQLVFPSTSHQRNQILVNRIACPALDLLGKFFKHQIHSTKFPSDMPSAMAGRPYESGEDDIENESTASEIPGDAESFHIRSVNKKIC